MRDRWRPSLRMIRSEDRIVPIFFAVAIAVALALILWSLSPRYGAPTDEILRGIYIEATGAVMDIVIFGIVIALLVLWTSRGRERDLHITRQRELIDDFKKWNADEARHRIAGALRRLNRLHCTQVDFSGIELTDFSFAWNEIRSIEGSTFYDGSWGTSSRKDCVVLKRVDFAYVNCRNVVFSKFNPLPGLEKRLRFASFKDCRFQNARLDGAIFRGAYLEWSEEPPREVGEWIDVGEGEKSFLQNYYSPFDGADLTGTSFEDVVFRNADFRDSLNIHHCSFVGAEGLDTCLFDGDEVKKQVLESARPQYD